jgi:hypothetical protein
LKDIAVMIGRFEFDAMKQSMGSQMLKERRGDCFGLRQVTAVLWIVSLRESQGETD